MTTKSYYVCSYAKHDYGFHTLRSCRSTKETYAAFFYYRISGWLSNGMKTKLFCVTIHHLHVNKPQIEALH